MNLQLQSDLPLGEVVPPLYAPVPPSRSELCSFDWGL